MARTQSAWYDAEQEIVPISWNTPCGPYPMEMVPVTQKRLVHRPISQSHPPRVWQAAPGCSNPFSAELNQSRGQGEPPSSTNSIMYVRETGIYIHGWQAAPGCSNPFSAELNPSRGQGEPPSSTNSIRYVRETGIYIHGCKGINGTGTLAAMPLVWSANTVNAWPMTACCFMVLSSTWHPTNVSTTHMLTSAGA